MRLLDPCMALSFVPLSRSVSRDQGRGLAALSPSILVLLGSLVSLALSWPHLMTVWRSGTFFDTDDAMRMVQVRDWLAGQAWFDLSVNRLVPSGALVMHWSRIVDVPLGALLCCFRMFTDGETAERLTRIVFPLGLQVGLIAAAVFASCVLLGPGARPPATFLAVTSCIQYGQFVAGRVDHHAPQITLLFWATGLCLNALIAGRARSAAWAATCCALSLAISLENLPFLAALVGALALAWVAFGATSAAALRAFGLALALAAAVLFVATVPPARYAAVETDAFSLPHLLAAVLGGIGFVLLPSIAGAGTSAGRRAAALAGSGLVVAALVVALCPTVLMSPYAQIDPVVRSVWLSRVTEAQPLPLVLGLHPQAVTLILCPLLVGLLASGSAAAVERGQRRAGWLLLCVLMLSGLGGSFWEVRILSSVTPLAIPGGIWVFASLLALARATRWRAPLLPACASLALFSPMAWLIVPVPDEDVRVAQATLGAAQCREAANVLPLAALGRATIFAPIDSGSHLLAHTQMSVIGAPYHRNNAQNRETVDGFSADPVQAEAIVKATGSHFVALCPGQVQAGALRERKPEGLAAALLEDRTPSWLVPVPIEGTRYKVFAVR